MTVSLPTMLCPNASVPPYYAMFQCQCPSILLCYVPMPVSLDPIMLCSNASVPPYYAMFQCQCPSILLCYVPMPVSLPQLQGIAVTKVISGYLYQIPPSPSIHTTLASSPVPLFFRRTARLKEGLGTRLTPLLQLGK